MSASGSSSGSSSGRGGGGSGGGGGRKAARKAARSGDHGREREIQPGGSARSVLVARLSAFYTIHKPENCAKIDKILEAYRDRPLHIFPELDKTYGTTASTAEEVADRRAFRLHKAEAKRNNNRPAAEASAGAGSGVASPPATPQASARQPSPEPVIRPAAVASPDHGLLPPSQPPLTASQTRAESAVAFIKAQLLWFVKDAVVDPATGYASALSQADSAAVAQPPASLRMSNQGLAPFVALVERAPVTVPVLGRRLLVFAGTEAAQRFKVHHVVEELATAAKAVREAAAAVREGGSWGDEMSGGGGGGGCADDDAVPAVAADLGTHSQGSGANRKVAVFLQLPPQFHFQPGDDGDDGAAAAAALAATYGENPFAAGLASSGNGTGRGEQTQLEDQMMAEMEVEREIARESERSSSPRCPRCRSKMVLRRNKLMGHEFYGCSTFPHCRGTTPSPPPETVRAIRTPTLPTPLLFSPAPSGGGSDRGGGGGGGSGGGGEGHWRYEPRDERRASAGGGGKQNYVVLLMVEEDAEAARFMQRCQAACPAAGRHCFQRDGTRWETRHQTPCASGHCSTRVTHSLPPRTV